MYLRVVSVKYRAAASASCALYIQEVIICLTSSSSFDIGSLNLLFSSCTCRKRTRTRSASHAHSIPHRELCINNLP
eukprot:3937790-Rhodomonas_salina.3